MARQPSSKEVINDDVPALLHAVYCVATIPYEIITEFIQKTRHEDFPIIMTSKDTHLSDYKESTRLPLDPFVSPFLGYDTEAVAQVYRKQAEGLGSLRYSSGGFVILDEQTIIDKTCLIVINPRSGLQTLRSDFDMALDAFESYNVMAWTFDEMKLAPFFYDGITITRELYERASGGEGGEYTPLFPKE